MSEIDGKFSELQFEEDTHTYKLNGSIIPSVTQLMKPLSDAVYGTVNDFALDMAATRGTAVHNAIENYLLFGIEDIQQEYEGYLEAFKKWFEKYKPLVIATEIKVYHKIMRYAGTADLIVEIDGQKILIDLKTSSVVQKMLTGVQLEAYDKAFDSQGIQLDGKAILHLKKDGTYDYDDKYKKNDSESWRTFGSLLVVYMHVKKYQGGS